MKASPPNYAAPLSEVEVLPPDGKGRAPTGKEAENASEVSRIIAHWMDEFIRIPGTNFRLGLDPLIGLFPGVGDLLASSVGVVVLTEGVRTRVPLSVLMRMGVNVLVNDAVGTIPVLGDIFSVWFKSNSRNLKLINQWKEGQQASVKRSSRIFLGVFVMVWLGLLAVWLTVWVALAVGIYKVIKGIG